MNNDNKIFRVFCIFSIAVLCALLVTTGILTAKYQTEQTVFGNSHEVVRIYEKTGSAVMSAGNKIAKLDFNDFSGVFDFVSHTFLAPIDNVIEIVRIVTGK